MTRRGTRRGSKARDRRCVAFALGLALGLGVGACADAGSSTQDDGGTSSGDTAAGSVLDEPYGACGDPDAPVACDDVDAAVAACAATTDPATGQLYRVCEPTCTDDADCPTVGAGNVPPQCEAGRCALVCNPAANVCLTGTVCVDGELPQCMWPVDAPAVHPDAADFCATACGPCGATLLLPWTTDCAATCEADLADCEAATLPEIFACTGGEGCPNGGGAVAQCLEGYACVDGG